MVDLSHIDPRLLDQLTLVVDDLSANTGLDPNKILVVGATCRDILHAAHGHDFEVRGTDDVDLGIAVSDWEVSERIESKYQRVGNNGIRYKIAGMSVDLMPFGDVEDPDGITTPARRGEDLIVFAFQDVYERAQPLTLPGGATVRMPETAGYAALKMRAWIDRSVDKDAKDLALCAYWYEESEEVSDRLYSPDEGPEIQAPVGWDYPLAAARLLRRDIAQQLTPAHHQDLVERWSMTDLGLFSRWFVLPPSTGRNLSVERRSAIAEQFGYSPEL